MGTSTDYIQTRLDQPEKYPEFKKVDISEDEPNERRTARGLYWEGKKYVSVTACKVAEKLHYDVIAAQCDNIDNEKCRWMSPEENALNLSKNHPKPVSIEGVDFASLQAAMIYLKEKKSFIHLFVR